MLGFELKESQGCGSLVGCCLWGRTESDTTDATQQQQQQQQQQRDIRVHGLELSEILLVLSLWQPHRDPQPVSWPPWICLFKVASPPHPPCCFSLCHFSGGTWSVQEPRTQVWDRQCKKCKTQVHLTSCDLSHFDILDSLRLKPPEAPF